MVGVVGARGDNHGVPDSTARTDPSAADPDSDPLAGFSAVTAGWFTRAFAAPTPAQAGAWQAIHEGAHTLVVAPTGSGKTLAAFLAGVDDILTQPPPADPDRRCRVLYVSPLKALASDVERNLRSPLVGIGQEAARAGEAVTMPVVAMRSGDSSASDRRRFATAGADILITTPESLFLLLTSQARQRLQGVSTVIIDEVHAVAGTKRGAHLAVSLERLDVLLQRPAQRIGLSATVRPVEEVARFLAGAGVERPTRVVQPASDKKIEVSVVVPVPDLGELGAGAAADEPAAASIWPHVEARVVDLIAPTPGDPSARSSLVFTNSRRLSERLTARLNEEWADRLERAQDQTEDAAAATDRGAAAGHPGRLPAEVMAQAGFATEAPAVLARAHHGSVSKEQRRLIEDDLKSGQLPAVVATSSLELGIDMGAVDLVVQVEAPPSVASGLQRVGRAGHQVGAVSRGVIFPKYRSDLITSAVAAERMRAGLIEELTVVANPLDVLAQQIVAMVAMDDWSVDALVEVLRRSAPFAGLTQPVLESVLDMLSGRYPSEDFAELRPRLVWDRATGMLSARAGAQRLAVTSGGTIPDRGLFGVFLAGAQETSKQAGRRVGELDEEMVYESRVGDVFTLGASSWQIVDITHDQVLVVPAPGRAGKLPFWHGDQPGRPYELGVAVGEFVRQIGAASPSDARQRLAAAGLDEWAADNLLAYLSEQRTATRLLPDDRTIVIERFRDELGDWRVVIHSPFGMSVHAPWAMAIAAAFRSSHDLDVQVMPADDGIVLRLPDTDLVVDDPAEDPAAGMAATIALPAAEIVERVTSALTGSALFTARFRECAARSLLLPRRRPDRRSPLWLQRQRASQLLEVASRFPTFPIVLETVRECLSDVFDVPGLKRLLTEIDSGSVRLVEVETDGPSPFAKSLLFNYVAQFLYEGDTPLAERRAAALALDPELLAELLGTDDSTRLAELLDPAAVLHTHAELQRTAPGRRARSIDDVADLPRVLGPLSLAEIRDRVETDLDAEAVVADLIGARRLMSVRIAGRDVVADPSDAGKLRDALGTALPVGLPVAFTEVEVDPLASLIVRHARYRAGFSAESLARRWGLGVAVVRHTATRLVDAGRLTAGELLPADCRSLLTADALDADQPAAAPAGLPGGEPLVTMHYCHPEVLRILRRRSLAALRAEVEPVPPAALARFVPGWQHVSRPLRGVDAVLRVVEQLAGVRLPASAWESLVLPARVADYSPGMLDELTSCGEVLWVGHGRLGNDDGWLSLHTIDAAPLTIPPPVADGANSPLHEAMSRFLGSGGGFFIRQIADAVMADPAFRQAVEDGTLPAADAGLRPDRPGFVSGADLAEALWDLIWQSQVTGDTLAGVRALLGTGRGRHATRRQPARARYARRPRLGARPLTDGSGLGSALADPGGGRARSARTGPGSVRTDPARTAGRWSALPSPQTDPTRRAALLAEVLLDRYGVLTRGSVVAEDVVGGFGAVYRVVAGLEEAGRVRRGYFVEGLGASQFAVTTAVDRLRAGEGDDRVVVLAATDPANVYGAALAWPPTRGDGGHRPARRAGALVVLHGGRLLAYAERGARTLLTFTDDDEDARTIGVALARAVSSGGLGGITIATVDGTAILGSGSGLESALLATGFHPTPRGLRLRR